MNEQTIKCSDCSSPLLHYLVTKADAPVSHIILVKCPFCNGESFKTTINGLFQTGPIGMDEQYKATVIDNIEYDQKNNMSTFLMKKR